MTLPSMHYRKRCRQSRYAVHISLLGLALATGMLLPRSAHSQTVDTVSDVPIETVGPARRYAFVVVGLAGDEEHREKFNQIVGIWRQWLTEIAGVEEQDIMLLIGNGENDAEPATAESIRTQVAVLNEHLTPDDSLWVFLLGHGSQDDRHGWFHLPGPDLNAAQWAGLFAPLETKEQLFWLTHSASGSFLKPLARPGRVVISATDDGEVNETRFPSALADTMRKHLNPEPSKDTTVSTPSTVLELFRETVRYVDQSFKDDNLVPTEHAKLDDNGDGSGTEAADVAVPRQGESGADPAVVDGAISDRIQITLKPIRNKLPL